jgi:uncharacterized protein (TIGR01244 family)
MKIPVRRLTDNLLVSSQLDVVGVAAAAAQGVRSIINNRPDGEAADQPKSAAIETAAAALGLGYRHIPVMPGGVCDKDIAAFDASLAELEPPVLAFCRTGTRSASLWALWVPPSDILSTTRAAGYDLDLLAPRLDARRRRANAAST